MLNLTTRIPGLSARKSNFSVSSGNDAPNFYKVRWEEIEAQLERLGLDPSKFSTAQTRHRGSRREHLVFKDDEREVLFPGWGDTIDWEECLPSWEASAITGVIGTMTWGEYFSGVRLTQ